GDLMWRYFELLSFRPLRENHRFRADGEGGANPRDIKFLLGIEIVDRFHGAGAGARSCDNLIARFQRGARPENSEEVVVRVPGNAIDRARLLKDAGMVSSSSEAIRMVEQGAVKIDGERVSDPRQPVAVGAEGVFQVGKRRVA